MTRIKMQLKDVPIDVVFYWTAYQMLRKQK